MAARIRFHQVGRDMPGFYILGGILVAVLLLGLLGAGYMATVGHHVSGMNNTIVWGTPHVFAILLILAASGALNTASVGSVFGRVDHKPLARLSGVLAIALLAGGLSVLLLDLGRPDRLMVAMTNYNLRSIFAWNIILYSGFFTVVAVYLWVLMSPRLAAWSRTAGTAAFAWRLILTTGTGSIFGFLLAREIYGSAVLAPLFIAASLAYGSAAFSLVLLTLLRSQGRRAPEGLLRGMAGMQGVFAVALLALLAMHFLTLTYMPGRQGAVSFMLLSGGVYPLMLWLSVLLGGVLPAAMLLYPHGADRARTLAVASLLILFGGGALLYALIIGGQVYPLNLFPGYTVVGAAESQLVPYAPTWPELVLGFGGVALATLIVMAGLWLLPLTPRRLPDEPTVEPASAALSTEAAVDDDGQTAPAAV